MPELIAGVSHQNGTGLTSDFLKTFLEVPKTRGLLRRFRATPDFVAIYKEAFRFYLAPHTAEEYEDFSNRFAGAVFEGAALSHISATNPDMIAGDDLLKYYHGIYPHAPVVERPLGQSSLQGITVPDAVCRKSVVTTVYECTLSEDESVFRRKYLGFSRERKKVRDIFGQARLVFITPANTALPIDVSRGRRVEHIEFPFSRRDFSDHMRSTYLNFRIVSDYPTLAELAVLSARSILMGNPGSPLR